jgi:hypothetical protein
MRPLPPELALGPFTRQQARALGVTDRQLDGGRFVRIYPRVFRLATHVMSDGDWGAAARLILPSTAHLTGISRIQQLGLDFGPRLPVRFVVEGDLHLAFENVFLHRTKRLPPTDNDGVCVEAAFAAYCARARVIDAIQVGDWLLNHGHTTIGRLRDYALSCLWRDGADEAVWVADHLDPRSRSLKESETRAVLCFAGLPTPVCNPTLPITERVVVIGDLWYPEWRVLVEYEGSQHQAERAVYLGDLDRHDLLWRAGIRYVLVTKERLAHARTLVGIVYRELVDAGYVGPPPSFGVQWELLFRGVGVAVGPRRDRLRRPAVG